MATPYQATAGPSRYHNPGIPPAPPSNSPSFSPATEPWVNGNGAMGPPETTLGRQGDERGDGGRQNPLVDLMDSERVYVDQLGLVIRVSLDVHPISHSPRESPTSRRT